MIDSLIWNISPLSCLELNLYQNENYNRDQILGRHILCALFHSQIRNIKYRPSYPSLFSRQSMSRRRSCRSRVRFKCHFRERRFANRVTSFVRILYLAYRARRNSRLINAMRKQAQSENHRENVRGLRNTPHSTESRRELTPDARAQASSAARRLEPTRKCAWLVSTCRSQMPCWLVRQLIAK